MKILILLFLIFANNTQTLSEEIKPNISNLTIKYKIPDIPIEKPINGGNVLRGFFAGIINSVVKIIVNLAGDVPYSIDGFEFEIPKEIDLTMFEYIKIKRLHLVVVDGKDKAHLKFLKEITIHAGGKKLTDTSSPSTLILSYNKSRDDLQCENRCLDFKVEEVNLIELIREQSILFIKPNINIDSTPNSKMQLSGIIEIGVGVDLNKVKK